MKCREFENKIYSYEELTDPEKALLEEHRSHCVDCNSLAEQVIQSQRLIRKVSTLKAEVRNPYQLTQRIMNSIARPKQETSLDKFMLYLDSLLVRYAFSTISLLLLVFFLYEQRAINTSDSIAKISKTEIKKGLVLNMSAFLYNHNAQRVRKEPPIARYTYYKAVGRTFNQ